MHPICPRPNSIREQLLLSEKLTLKEVFDRALCIRFSVTQTQQLIPVVITLNRVQTALPTDLKIIIIFALDQNPD